ncbi:MAG: TolC family protein, partial [Betaproteobacteria bacterium]
VKAHLYRQFDGPPGVCPNVLESHSVNGPLDRVLSGLVMLAKSFNGASAADSKATPVSCAKVKLLAACVLLLGGHAVPAQTASGPDAAPPLRWEGLASKLAVPAQNLASPTGTLSLDEMVSSAITVNPNIQAARSTRLGAENAIDVARWQRYPSLSLLAENRVSGSGNYSFSGTQISRTARLELPIWNAGRISAEIDVAKLKSISAQWAIEEAKDQVANKTAQAWRNLIAAYGALTVDKNTLAQLNDFESKIQRRTDAGVSAQVDREAVLARRLQVLTEVASSNAQLNVAIERLRLLVGKSVPLNLPAGMQDIKTQFDKAVLPAALLQPQTLDTAAEQQPAYLRALTESQIAGREIAVAEARRFPELVARYQYQASSAGLPATDGYFVGLNYQSGSGLATFAQIKSAQSRLQTLQNSADSARLEAAEALLAESQDYADALKRLQLGEQATAQANSLLEANLRLFDVGRRSVFEILSTQRETASNERSLAPLRAQVIASAYLIRVRLGQWPWQQRAAAP